MSDGQITFLARQIVKYQIIEIVFSSNGGGEFEYDLKVFD